jgi:DNA-binding transcriptional MerR regulator
MKIKQVSKLTGLTEKTIRYYESKGLITPDIHDLNGRSFRDYGKEQISALRAVSILRKARFSIEQISTMQGKPEKITETINCYLINIDDALNLLTSIKVQLENEDLSSLNSIYDLASCLEPITKNAELPPLDLKFNFKRFDKLSADNIKHVNSKPVLNLRFGWFKLYSGHDINRYQDIKSKLTSAGLIFKATEYTATTRLSIQGLANQGSAFKYNKGLTVSPEGLQAKMLSDKALDMYYIEVRKRDSEKAREALRLLN